MSAALGSLPASYDQWKTTPPEPRAACAVCSDWVGVEPDDIAARHGDDLLCSYRCESVYLARTGDVPRQVMQHVADAMSAGADITVHALLMGGGREARGPVVDWSVDGAQLVVENVATGNDCQVRVDNVRRIEVLS